jgi:hypothetical protein
VGDKLGGALAIDLLALMIRCSSRTTVSVGQRSMRCSGWQASHYGVFTEMDDALPYKRLIGGHAGGTQVFGPRTLGI